MAGDRTLRALALACACAFVAADASIRLTEAQQRQRQPTREEWEEKKAEEAARASAAAAKEAKMKAVNKIVEMMEGVKKQVMAEGEKEAATYNKFACFCKDTTAEKTASIKAGQDEKAELETNINSLMVGRDDLDASIAEATAAVDKAEKEVKAAEAQRGADLRQYEANVADLASALRSLEQAIADLKQSKAPSLVQIQSVVQTVQNLAMIADALGIDTASSRHTTAFLQQAPDVPMEDYKFHSDDILETLETLLKKFTAEKTEVDAEEVKSVAAHDSFIQEQTDFIAKKNKEIADDEAAKQEHMEAIAAKNEQLTTVSATLLDDTEYLGTLSQMCSDKAKTWDQRSKVRQDELSMLVEVQGILSGVVADKTSAATIRFVQEGAGIDFAKAIADDGDAMSRIEAAAESADAGTAISFLQQRRTRRGLSLRISEATLPAHSEPDQPQRAVAALLLTKGRELKSTLLTSLASRIAGDPFVKVKRLLQDLIERLEQEATSEATQKAWCDKATADAKQKRENAAQAVEELNSEMAELEALRDQLGEEITTLSGEILELKTEVNETVAERQVEKSENAATVMEASEGLEAVSMALEILDQFYKTVKKSTVSLAQAGAKASPDEDAPDAGFDNFEAYTGSQGEAGGLLGMMDVIKSDFQRTISETKNAERKAEQDHLEFMTRSGSSIAAKTTAHDEKVKYKDEAVEKLAAADQELDSQNAILQQALNELLELKPACVDTGMSYEERVARREDEIKALEKALCILQAYHEYGPEGSSQC